MLKSSTHYSGDRSDRHPSVRPYHRFSFNRFSHKPLKKEHRQEPSRTHRCKVVSLLCSATSLLASPFFLGHTVLNSVEEPPTNQGQEQVVAQFGVSHIRVRSPPHTSSTTFDVALQPIPRRARLVPVSSSGVDDNALPFDSPTASEGQTSPTLRWGGGKLVRQYDLDDLDNAAPEPLSGRSKQQYRQLDRSSRSVSGQAVQTQSEDEPDEPEDIPLNRGQTKENSPPPPLNKQGDHSHWSDGQRAGEPAEHQSSQSTSNAPPTVQHPQHAEKDASSIIAPLPDAQEQQNVNPAPPAVKTAFTNKEEALLLSPSDKPATHVHMQKSLIAELLKPRDAALGVAILVTAGIAISYAVAYCRDRRNKKAQTSPPEENTRTLVVPVSGWVSSDVFQQDFANNWTQWQLRVVQPRATS